jgi:hypothetical protein
MGKIVKGSVKVIKMLVDSYSYLDVHVKYAVTDEGDTWIEVNDKDGDSCIVSKSREGKDFEYCTDITKVVEIVGDLSMYLTEGKMYPVVGEDEDYYTLIDDEDDEYELDKAEDDFTVIIKDTLPTVIKVRILTNTYKWLCEGEVYEVTKEGDSYFEVLDNDDDAYTLYKEDIGDRFEPIYSVKEDSIKTITDFSMFLTVGAIYKINYEDSTAFKITDDEGDTYTLYKYNEGIIYDVLRADVSEKEEIKEEVVETFSGKMVLVKSIKSDSSSIGGSFTTYNTFFKEVGLDYLANHFVFGATLQEGKYLCLMEVKHPDRDINMLVLMSEEGQVFLVHNGFGEISLYSPTSLTKEEIEEKLELPKGTLVIL